MSFLPLFIRRSFFDMVGALLMQRLDFFPNGKMFALSYLVDCEALSLCIFLYLYSEGFILKFEINLIWKWNFILI